MTVSGLYVYPVKSLRGISLDRSLVETTGLRYDRHWMIVDESGRFRTQRQLPQMTFLATAFVEGGLELSSDRSGSIEVPFESEGELLEGTVWSWTGPVERVGELVDQWLSDALQMSCRLVKMAPDSHRSAKVGDGSVEFPDAMPVLVAGEESLRSLNQSLAEPVPMNRFRANLIIRGSAPYAEDEWSGLSIGDVELQFGRRCGRCLVTTTDQLTGERHRGEEPLRTLARTRKYDGAACFGAYYSPVQQGTIAIGERISLRS